MKVLDIFAGAGGFSLGFKLAGFNIVGAIEEDLLKPYVLEFR